MTQLPEGDTMGDHYCSECGAAWRDCACDEPSCPWTEDSEDTEDAPEDCDLWHNQAGQYHTTNCNWKSQPRRAP
jgi:hypothetical protein